MIDIQRENNVYYQNNPIYFNELCNIVKNNKKQFPAFLKHGKKYLLDWINCVLPECILCDSVFKYSLSTQCAWIFSGLSDFPECQVCHKNDNFKHKNVKALIGYSKFCCVRCAQMSDEVKNKTIKTNIERYNQSYFTQTDSYIEKTTSTNKLKYGVEWACQSPVVIENIKNSMIKSLGVPCAFMAEQTKQKSAATCLQRYGVLNGGCSQKAFKKMHRKYLYDNLQFDSAPELAYYIWLKDNNIKFQFQPEHSFEYEHNGKKFLYFPDFFLEDEQQFVEIKGDHFFVESGQMICPFRKKKWSDERYADECAKYEAKHQCMLKNNVKIMRSDEYLFFVQYIQEKHGKDFFKNTRRCK